MEDSESKIYYIVDSNDESGGYGDDSYIKIGYTTGNAKHRLDGLQVGNPRPLLLLYTEPGGIELEKEMHELCAKYRVRGEWFLYNQEFVDIIWPSIRKRSLNLVDKLKEQSWIDEMEEINVIREKYEKIRDELQARSVGEMFYLMED